MAKKYTFLPSAGEESMTGENLKERREVSADGRGAWNLAGAMGEGGFSCGRFRGVAHGVAGRPDGGKAGSSVSGALKRGAGLCLCALLLVVGGCAPQPASTPGEEATPPVSGDPFAAAVSRLMPGEQVVMATPFGGEGVVQLEGSYTSGLGQSCRRAQATVSGVSHRVAVCLDENGWFTAGSIFENLPR